MKYFPIVLPFIFTALSLSSSAGEAGKVNRSSNENYSSASKMNKKVSSGDFAPMGFVVVDEQVSLDTQALPLMLLDESVADFNAKNFGEAAGDLKSAACFIRTNREKSMSETTKDEMAMAADGFDKVAKDLRGEEFKAVDNLKSALAEVAYHQSMWHRLRATSAWQKRQMRSAGYDLNAAADALEWSMSASGKYTSDASSSSLKKSREVATKLITGSSWTAEEVNSAFDRLIAASNDVNTRMLKVKDRAASMPENF
jgi:hypothetical protein